MILCVQVEVGRNSVSGTQVRMMHFPLILNLLPPLPPVLLPCSVNTGSREEVTSTTEDLPAKLFEDLLLKTKAAPRMHWLPLKEEQLLQQQAARAEQMKEREKRWKEHEEEVEKKREERRKERMKSRGVVAGEGSEGERDGDRKRKYCCIF